MAQDFRGGGLVTPKRVEQWVRQFSAESQNVVLAEMERVLGQTYLSRLQAIEYLESFFADPRIFGTSPGTTLRNTEFLRLARKGSSQRDLLSLADDVLNRTHGIDTRATKASPRVYVYMDDALYTGNTLYYDIKEWLGTVPAGSILHIYFFAVHTSGWTYVRDRLEGDGLWGRVEGRIWAHRWYDTHEALDSKQERIWPRQFDSEEVEGYAQRLLDVGSARLFRPNSVQGDVLFSSEQARDIVEREFLTAGVRITNLSNNPKLTMRPLGYEKLRSFGFGSLLVTYRNISNNCPLCLWWGDTSYPDTHPFSQWEPLFPRQGN